MHISKDTVVTIDYTLKDNEGQVLDSSDGRQPLAYLHGSGNLIPGLESALEGKSPGQELAVSVPPDEAYGHKDPQLVQSVPLSMFPEPDKVQAGMTFHAQTEAGKRSIRVTKVDGQDVTIDANHPLAGETLNFDVKIVGVRPATPEEVQHGHVHGPGGHQH